MEVEAVDEGGSARSWCDEGTEGVKVNAVIADPAGGRREGSSPSDGCRARSSTGCKRRQPAKPAAPAPAAAAGACRQPAATFGGSRIFASPLAKRIAADKGIDLAGIKGSGPNGRIVKADVEKRQAGAAAALPAPPAAPRQLRAVTPAAEPGVRAAGDSACRTPRIRKVIARRMLESKQTVPHFYLTVDFEIDALLAARTGDQRGRPRRRAPRSRSTTW